MAVLSRVSPTATEGELRFSPSLISGYGTVILLLLTVKILCRISGRPPVLRTTRRKWDDLGGWFHRQEKLLTAGVPPVCEWALKAETLSLSFSIFCILGFDHNCWIVYFACFQTLVVSRTF